MPQEVDIQLREGTAAQWSAVNPVLDLGEPGYETDTGKLKIGNGTSAWGALPYFVPGLPTPSSIGALAVANNLSDLASIAAAVANLLPGAVQIVTSSGTVPVPSWANHAVADVVGSGAGGGGGGSALTSGGVTYQVGGSGAGAGAWVKQLLTLQSADHTNGLSAAIGAGGAGGAGGAADGNAGAGGNFGSSSTLTSASTEVVAPGGTPGFGGGANTQNTVTDVGYAGLALLGGYGYGLGMASQTPTIMGLGGMARADCGVPGAVAFGHMGRCGGGGGASTGTLGGGAGGTSIVGQGKSTTVNGVNAPAAPANTGQGGDGGGGGAAGGTGGNGGAGGSGLIIVRFLP